MNYWLIKSEPDTWSWDDQNKSPKKTTEWDGVRNYQANNCMKDMAKGDRCFFYHSGKERSIVGMVQVVKTWELDPTDKTGRSFGMVTVMAIQSAKSPTTLAQIKDEAKLKDMVLVKNSRLSVQPVTGAQWKQVCKMAKLSNKQE